MKVNDILFEAMAGTLKTEESVAQRIKTECSDMLDACIKADAFLYRGIKDFTGAYKNIPIRQDRKPVELKASRHELLHHLYVDAGLKATRKNSIFCTTDISLARDWGELYVVFVKNGWSATVFSGHSKGYTYFDVSAIATRMQSQNGTNEYSTEKEDFDPADWNFAKKQLAMMGAKNIDSALGLSGVITSKYEDVLITGQSYIAVREDKIDDLFNNYLKVK